MGERTHAGGLAYGVLLVGGGDPELSIALLYELRALQVVTDDAEPDHLKNRSHGSRVLNDAYQKREKQCQLSRQVLNPPKVKVKRDTHDSSGHEYVDVPRFWREPARDFQKLRFEICCAPGKGVSLTWGDKKKRKRAKNRGRGGMLRTFRCRW